SPLLPRFTSCSESQRLPITSSAELQVDLPLKFFRTFCHENRHKYPRREAALSGTVRQPDGDQDLAENRSGFTLGCVRSACTDRSAHNSHIPEFPPTCYPH